MLEKVKQEIEAEFNVPVGYATIDVSQAASVKAGVEAAVKEFGKIDIVISNGQCTFRGVGYYLSRGLTFLCL